MFMSPRLRSSAILLVALLVPALTIGLRAPAAAADGKLTIVYVSDVHGHIEPFTKFKSKEEVGALAKVAVYVDELRKKNANVLLLSAGDMVHGANIVNFFGGLPMIEVMNYMRFDAMALGNPEFHCRQEQLIRLAQEAKFPFLSANVFRDDGALFAKGYAVFDIGGVKVGVFGLTSPATPSVTHPRNVAGLRFADPAATAAKVVDTLADQVDIIVCLSHLSYEVDKALASAVPGIDVIVGGHSGSRACTSGQPQALMESPETIDGVIIVQNGEWAEYVGVLDLTVAGGEVASFDGGLVRMTRDMPGPAPGSPLSAMISGYKTALAEKMAVKAGSTSVPLDGEASSVRTRTTNLGNLVTDAMREFAGADVAFANGGGIRAGIDAGDITIGDVYTALPFSDTLVAIKLTGEKILAALEHSLSKYPEPNAGFCQVSGIIARFDPQKPAGSRLVEVLVGGEPIVADKHYILATNDFMAAGGDGYVWFTQSTPVFRSGAMFSDILTDYIRARGAVDAPNEMRIQPIS